MYLAIIAIGFLLLGLFLYNKTQKKKDKTRQDVDYLLIGVCFIFMAIFLYKFVISRKNSVIIFPHSMTVSMPNGPTFKLPGGTFIDEL